MQSFGATLEWGKNEFMRPSSEIPTNVNKVRPADIKVIGALGDSHTTAYYSRNHVDDPPASYVGNSFVIGGDETMETNSTFANILRHFNPDLIGYSTGVGDEGRGFNVAVVAKTAEDLPRQAHELIEKMKADKRVNIAEDWKLVHIFIGTKDVAYCLPPADHKKGLEEVIQILHEALPRTIVSIISMLQPEITMLGYLIAEAGAKEITCPDPKYANFKEDCSAIRKVEYENQNERKFDTDDFTVVVQGFMDEHEDALRNSSGNYEKLFYTDDRTHLSKYGNGVVGKFLWNSILEPVGRKQLGPRTVDVPLSCPSAERQFIATLQNSL